MKPRYSVTVTRSDYLGKVFDSDDCPFARAITRATGVKACIGLNHGHLVCNPIRDFIIPLKAMKQFRVFMFIPRQIRWLLMPSFTFELDLF